MASPQYHAGFPHLTPEHVQANLKLPRLTFKRLVLANSPVSVIKPGSWSTLQDWLSKMYDSNKLTMVAVSVSYPLCSGVLSLVWSVYDSSKLVGELERLASLAVPLSDSLFPTTLLVQALCNCFLSFNDITFSHAHFQPYTGSALKQDVNCMTKESCNSMSSHPKIPKLF